MEMALMKVLGKTGASVESKKSPIIAFTWQDQLASAM